MSSRHIAKIPPAGLLALSLAFSCPATANKSHHRDHGAHVHGGGALSLAFDGLEGRVEFKSPADSIVGFEHEAKSEKDKKTLAATVQKFEKETSKLVQFDPSCQCTFQKDNVGVQRDGEHSDFLAYFDVKCQKPITGTKVTFDFTSFKKLDDLDVTLLVDQVTKTAEIRKQVLTVDLNN